MNNLQMTRIWTMPTGDTFDIAPLKELVWRYLKQSKVSVDPFARNKQWATYTNDLNPKTDAQYHMDSIKFLEMLLRLDVKVDLILFDPPYSPTQIKELYDGIGLDKINYAHRTHAWNQEKDLLLQMAAPNCYFVYCGWDTNGMGKSRGFTPVEGLVLTHGPGHHDTLVLVEQYTNYGKQLGMFDE